MKPFSTKLLALAILFTALGARPALAISAGEAEQSRLMEEWSQLADTNPQAFLQALRAEADIYAAIPADDAAAVNERNVKTNILLGIAMNVKESAISKNNRVTAVVNLLAKAYRHKTFRGIEMVVADYKANRVLYDAKIAKIPSAKIRKLIKEDLNAYLQPAAD